MNKMTQFFCLMFAAVLLLSASSAASAWENGLDADVVLGQSNFGTRLKDTATRSVTNCPSGICLDPSTGSIFVMDGNNHRVLRWSSEDAYTSGSDAAGVLGQENFTSNEFNRGGDAAANTMFYPDRCVVSNEGALYVSDRANNRVLRFDNAAAKPDGADADGVLGQENFTSKEANRGGGVAAGTLKAPRGLVLDASGRLWVADEGNNRVLRYPAGAADGASAEKVLGQGDFNSAVETTAQNRMWSPLALAMTSEGDLIVAEQTNGRVLIFKDVDNKPDGGNADVVLGQDDFTTRESSPPLLELLDPEGLALSASNELFVSDHLNNRILVYNDVMNKPIGGKADKVIGQADFTTNGNATTIAGMKLPWGLAYDKIKNRLWVADSMNYRIISYGLNGSPSFSSSLSNSTGEGPVDLTLVGTGFMNGAEVKMIKDGDADITATNVTVVSATKITCTIDLTEAAKGTWSLVVTNPDKTKSVQEFSVGEPEQKAEVVPSLQEWGILLTALLLAGFAVVRIRRQAV